MSTSERNDNGGPAFAAVAVGPDDSLYHQIGMTLRDWFAGQALAGWLSSFPHDSTHPASRGPWASELALNSYRLADAMLAERAKTKCEQQ